MRDGWSISKIKDVATVVTGTTPSSKFAGNWGGLVPFLTPSDMGYHNYNASTERSLSIDAAKRMDGRIIKSEATAVVCIGATIGKVARVTEPTLTNQQINTIIPTIGKLDPKYSYYLLGTMRDYLMQIASGSATPLLNKSRFENVEILLPTFVEQQRIAAVLGSLDDLINANQSLIRRCELLAQTIAYSATKTTTLSELATDAKISTEAPSGLTDHYSLPAFDDHRTPQRVIGSLIKSNKLIVTNPSVLIARLNPHIPRVWMVYPSPDVPSATSTEFVPIEGTSVTSEEIWAACSDPRFISQMQSLVTGTTGSHQRVDKRAVLDLKIPNFLELSSADRTAIHELVLESYRANQGVREIARTRDELLPLLLSGAIHVKDVAA